MKRFEPSTIGLRVTWPTTVPAIVITVICLEQEAYVNIVNNIIIVIHFLVCEMDQKKSKGVTHPGRSLA